jgi:hypothetical protein
MYETSLIYMTINIYILKTIDVYLIGCTNKNRQILWIETQILKFLNQECVVYCCVLCSSLLEQDFHPKLIFEK